MNLYRTNTAKWQNRLFGVAAQGQMADEKQLHGQKDGLKGKRSQCHSSPIEEQYPRWVRSIKLPFILSGGEGRLAIWLPQHHPDTCCATRCNTFVKLFSWLLQISAPKPPSHCWWTVPTAWHNFSGTHKMLVWVIRGFPSRLNRDEEIGAN